MENTAAVPTAVTYVQKNTVTEDMFDKTSDKVKESAFDNMEMTCSLSASLKEKIRSNLEPKISNCAKPLNQSPKQLDESSMEGKRMEMTVAVVVPTQPEQIQNDTENMEFTCALPIVRKVKVNPISAPKSISSLKPSSIEENCMNTTEVLVCSKNTVSDAQNLDRSVPVAIVTDDENHMELPSSKSTTIAQNESMEMSATLNFQQKFGESVIETKAFASNCSLEQNEAIQETSKGQLISECFFDFLNFPKKHRKI